MSKTRGRVDVDLAPHSHIGDVRLAAAVAYWAGLLALGTTRALRAGWAH